MEVSISMNSNDFASLLQMLRRRNNYTQEELSKKLNISRQAYSNYEQGRCFPSINVLIDMSIILRSNLLCFFIKNSRLFDPNSNVNQSYVSEEETTVLNFLYQALSPLDKIKVITGMLDYIEESEGEK